MKVQGNVFKYGDNVDTDVIIPARYLNSSDRRNLRRTVWRISTRILSARFRKGI